MARAVDWPRAAQNDLVVAALFVYAVPDVAMAVGARAPKYGRGIWTVHGLWIGQIAWGLYALFT